MASWFLLLLSIFFIGKNRLPRGQNIHTSITTNLALLGLLKLTYCIITDVSHLCVGNFLPILIKKSQIYVVITTRNFAKILVK